MPVVVINRRSVLAPNISDLYKTAILGDSPVAYWRLGEAAGSVAIDETGNNTNNGTYVGSPSLNNPALITSNTNKSVIFSGTNYVSITNSTNVSFTNNFSVEAWAKTTNISMNALIAGNYNSNTNQGAGIGIYASYIFATFNGGAGFLVNYPTITNGNPHHVVVVYSGNAGNLTVTIYVDGAPVGSTNNRIVTPSSLFRIASRPNMAGEFFGTIDEVAVYNYVLSGTQIQNHYLVGTT